MKVLKLGIALGLLAEIARKLLKRNRRYRKLTTGSCVGSATDFALDSFLLPSPYASSFGGFVGLLTCICWAAGGTLASVFDSLAAESKSARGAHTADIPAHMSTMSLVGGGLIAGDSLGPVSSPSPLLLETFLRAASLVLLRETPSLGRLDAANRYSLRAAPNPAMRLDFLQTVSNSGQGILDFTASLENVIGGALEGCDRDQFISLIGPTDENLLALGPVPRLVSSGRGEVSSRGLQAATKLPLVAIGGTVTSLPLILTPDRAATPTAHAIMASTLVQPVSGNHSRLNLVLAQDHVLAPAVPSTTAILSLPVVDNPSAELWKDRADASKYWYPPSFVLVRPVTNQDPAASPFLFSFAQSGVTGGTNPAPGLNCTARFTLERVLPDETRAALQSLGNPAAVPVPTSNLSIQLEVPFLDEQTRSTKMQAFIAELVEQDGRITANPRLPEGPRFPTSPPPSRQLGLGGPFRESALRGPRR